MFPLDRSVKIRITAIVVAIITLVFIFAIGSAISKRLFSNKQDPQASVVSDMRPSGDEEAKLVDSYPNYVPEVYEASKLISSSSTALENQQLYQATYTVQSTVKDVFYYYQDALSEVKGYRRIEETAPSKKDSAQLVYAKDPKAKNAIKVSIVKSDESGQVDFVVRILETVKTNPKK